MVVKIPARQRMTPRRMPSTKNQMNHEFTWFTWLFTPQAADWLALPTASNADIAERCALAAEVDELSAALAAIAAQERAVAVMVPVEAISDQLSGPAAESWGAAYSSFNSSPTLGAMRDVMTVIPFAPAGVEARRRCRER